MRYLVGITVSLAMLSVGPFAWAQDEGLGSSFGVKLEKDAKYAKINTDRPYRPALDIKFPWKQYENPTVEVRLITNPNANPNEIAPLYFGSDMFRGKMKQACFDARDAALSMGSTETIKIEDNEYTVVGLRTTPGGPGVYVLRDLLPTEEPGGIYAAFHFLNGWAIDKDRLYIDMPREYFAEKGDLYIWFTRNGKPIWSQKMAWPGIGQQAGEE